MHRGGGKLKDEVGNLDGLRFCIRRGRSVFYSVGNEGGGFIFILKKNFIEYS